MPRGMRKLQDALPREEQAKWARVRVHLREQRASAVSIHGEGEKVEQLDRATRLEMAMLVNERLTYYGVKLFHCYAPGATQCGILHLDARNLHEFRCRCKPMPCI